MLARSSTVIGLALFALLLAAPRAPARAISWSGYTWDVRPDGVGGPGPNAWSDSEANVRVEGTDLVLSVAQDASGRWTSAEIDNQRHLGYGTYRWVVATDLSGLDANEVLGMFTYGGDAPSNAEIDIEPSHWGRAGSATGSATVWQDAAAGLRRSASFSYSAHPPYVNAFTWEPGRVHYLVTDATGAALLDWTVTEGVPVPSSEVPMINYWRFAAAPPASARSVRFSSFTWAPPGPGTAPAPVSRCSLAAAAGRRPSTLVRWSATADATLRVVVRRIVHGRRVAVRVVTRTVHSGAGRLRLAGRRLRPGRYRIAASLATGSGDVACGPDAVRLTVRR